MEGEGWNEADEANDTDRGGEQEQPGFISIGEIKPAAPVASKAEVVQHIEETVSGD